jgi:hypothetical protein
MQIANPIYDAVFKYLMDDNKIAKKLLSLIIGKKIKSLKFSPKEFEDKIESKSWTIYRIDFAAEIELEDGTIQKVIIEVQKAKFASDIMRFRRYLASQYSDKNNTYADSNGKHKAMPILSIYILGQPLGNILAPIIKVDRVYKDLTEDKKINTKNEFIEALTHDSFIIQIPLLNKKGRTKLEKVLSVFENKEAYQHFVNIDENNYPKGYADIIRRLTKAAAEPDVMDRMDIEDELIEEFEEIERDLEKKSLQLEEKSLQLKEKTQELVAKDQKLEEKDQELEEKDQELEEKEQKLEEKDQKLVEKDQKLVEKDQKLVEKDQELKKEFERAEKAKKEKEKLMNMAIQTLMDQGFTEEKARKSLGLL